MITNELIQTLSILLGGGFVLILFIRFLVTQALSSGIESNETVIAPAPPSFVVKEQPSRFTQSHTPYTLRSDEPTVVEVASPFNRKGPQPGEIGRFNVDDIRQGIIMSEILSPKWAER